MRLNSRRVSVRLALSYLMIVFLTATIAASGGGAAAGQSAESFDLVNGSFTLTTVDGDTLSGDYSGQASVSPSGRTTASLILNVTGGTNLFQGATGTIVGDGTGAFLGEGGVSISFRGSVSTTADPSGFRVRGKVSGTSSISDCGIEGISVTVSSDGSFGKQGNVHAVLTHLAPSGGCSP